MSETPSGLLDNLLNRSEMITSQPGALGMLQPQALSRMLSIARAMNDLHEREELLAYLRDRLRELFDAENSLVVILDKEGRPRILGASARASAEAISQTLLNRVLQEARTVLVRDTAQDPQLKDRQSIQRLGLVSVLAAPLIVDHRVIGVIQFEQRNRPTSFSEEDLVVLELFAHQAAPALKNMLLVEQLEQALDKMREAQALLVATERLRALGEMSAAVAHSFNNMLASILGISDLLLREDTLAPRAREDVETLRRAATSGAALVRRLQAFAGGPGGDEQVGPLDVCALIDDVLAMCRPRLEGKNPIHCKVSTPQGTGPVLGRSTDFKDVIMNLLTNACEAMPAGGDLAVRVWQQHGQVLIEIEDSGVGIDPKLLHRIWEPFFTTRPAGNGLGLSICWGTVHRMGGTIHVRPAAERGTVFTVSLPRTEQTAPQPVPRETPVPAHLPANILVVDDDGTVRQVICRMIESEGFTAEQASSAHEALELLAQRPFDLVLTDFGMPHMNGHALAKEIAARGYACPVVLLSGWNPGVDCPAESDDLAAVLRKPITINTLTGAISRALSPRRRRGTADSGGSVDQAVL